MEGGLTLVPGHECVFSHGYATLLVFLKLLDHLWHGAPHEELMDLEHDLELDDAVGTHQEEQMLGGLPLGGEARRLLDEAHQVRDHLRVVHTAVTVVGCGLTQLFDDLAEDVVLLPIASGAPVVDGDEHRADDEEQEHDGIVAPFRGGQLEH